MSSLLLLSPKAEDLAIASESPESVSMRKKEAGDLSLSRCVAELPGEGWKMHFGMKSPAVASGGVSVAAEDLLNGAQDEFDIDRTCTCRIVY